MALLKDVDGEVFDTVLPDGEIDVEVFAQVPIHPIFEHAGRLTDVRLAVEVVGDPVDDHRLVHDVVVHDTASLLFC